MRIRTIQAGFEELKAADPHTGLTLCAMRRLIASGALPSYRVGRKILFDLDDLNSLIAAPKQEQQPTMGKIRALPTRL